jgi:hypothetical protein
MLLWPRRHVQRIEDRIQTGGDQFFEEQKTYRAYPFLRNPSRVRLVGAIGTICGLIAVAISLYRDGGI